MFKMIFKPNGTFGANHAPILRQDEHYLKTDRTKLSLKPRRHGVPPGASKSDF
jgi:hypothetical protein